MTKTQNTAGRTYDTRVAELRASGMRIGEAHATAKRENIADQTTAWRALDSER